MRHYFSLHFRLLNRHIQDFGLHPILGWLLGLLAFIGLSFYIFHKTEFAVYAYLFMAVSLLTRISNTARNVFLRSCYPDRRYRVLRFFENGFVVLSFLIFMLAKGRFLESGVLIAIALGLVFLKLDFGNSITLPTPFGKRPFEFVVGFRKTFYLHLFAYFIAVMSIVVQNFNLGIFSSMLVFLVCLLYYADMEPDFYVWTHAQQPRVFLAQKIKWAFIYSNILALPITIALSIFFKENIHIILAAPMLGSLYLIAMVLAKYSAYPNNIGVPESFLLAFSLAMPPMLLLVVPYFYHKSIKRLALVL